MADKKEKKGKKILLIALAVAVVAIIVVMLVVFLPKGKSTAEAFREVSQITIADNEEAKADYVAFEEKVANTSGVQYYSEEVGAVKTLTNSLDAVADFYHEYYLFAENNGYNGEINDGISQIANTQKKLNKILANSKQDVDAGMSIVQNTWVEYRANYSDLLRGYQKLFSGMNKAYHTALGNVLVANKASKMIFNTVDDYISVIIKDVDKLVASNLSGSKESTYSPGNLSAKIEAFENFVKEYVKNRTHIENYYNQSPEVYDNLEKFEEVFADDMQSVIDAIEFELILTSSYTNDIASTSLEAAQILLQTKVFVLGGAV